MTRFENTGRVMRVQTYTGKTWIEAKETRVADTDAPHLAVGVVQWVYEGDDCGGARPWGETPEQVEAFMRSYIGRERVQFTREGF